MFVELFAFGEYKNAKIMLKKGNFLKEFPYFYDEFSLPCICNYILYSSISNKLNEEKGLAAVLANIEGNNLYDQFAERGGKRPKIGELIRVKTQLSH